MRIADRKITWDARSVLTWQYDKAVNMIAFLSLWQKWIDVNCNQVYHGSETRLITKENCSDNGYSSFSSAYDSSTHPYSSDDTCIKKYDTVDALKSALIPISQNWKSKDAVSEASDANTGTTLIEDNGREIVNHIGDTFKMSAKRMYRCYLDDDGGIVREWINVVDDTAYATNPDTEEDDGNSVKSEVAKASVAGLGNWYESERVDTYVTWNGEQWVECPTYNHEYAGGWYNDIYAIDTCNEFGLNLWAKMIGVELPMIYSSDTDKTCAQQDENNEIWRTYLKARFYRIMTNASMHEVKKYLHYVFEQFDNHEILVDDGGLYDIGTVSDGTFIEAQNSASDSSGATGSGAVVTIVTVDPEDTAHEWDVTNTLLDTFRNDETIVKVGYKLLVTDSRDATKAAEKMTVASLGKDCVTVSNANGSYTFTEANEVKARFLGDWLDGYTILRTENGYLICKSPDGDEVETVNRVRVKDSAGEWIDDCYVVTVSGTLVTVGDQIGRTHFIQSDAAQVKVFGDWEENYTVVSYDSETGKITVADEDGNETETENSVCIYDNSLSEWAVDMSVVSVDHNGYVVQSDDGTSKTVDSAYTKMCPYLDIKYYGVDMMTIKYSSEFNQSVIERVILSLSDFLPHPSAVLSSNTMFAGEDLIFGFNTKNVLPTALYSKVPDEDGNYYYVSPYQSADDNDCGIPVVLRTVCEYSGGSYLAEKETVLSEKHTMRSIDDVMADTDKTTNKVIPSWVDIFVCYAVNANGTKGKGYWAYGVKWEDAPTGYANQCPLYKYDSAGKVVTGSEATPIMYDESCLVGEKYVGGWYVKVAKNGSKWQYYDGRYDQTNAVSSKWKDLLGGSGSSPYYYKYTPIGGAETEYIVEFDEDGEPKYVNSELRCFKDYEAADNSIARRESYNAGTEACPLDSAQNQCIANAQSVTYAGEFISDLERMKEYNLFKRKDIDAKNGGYFKGSADSTPVGFTEIVRAYLKEDYEKEGGVDNEPRRYELWYKNAVTREGIMMKEVYARKSSDISATYEPSTVADEYASYYHESEFSNGVFTGAQTITNLATLKADRVVTKEFVGIKIKYSRTEEKRTTGTDKYSPFGVQTHPVQEYFLHEPKSTTGQFDLSNEYKTPPKEGTYIIDFVYTPIDIKKTVEVTENGVTTKVIQTETYQRFRGVRFLMKLKDGETDNDANLSWSDRLAKYEYLTKSDVGESGMAKLVPGTNAAMMPTCDYGFKKYKFADIEKQDSQIQNVSYYYGCGYDPNAGKPYSTYGGKAIPTPITLPKESVFETELSLISLWGQNNLESMGHGGLYGK